MRRVKMLRLFQNARATPGGLTPRRYRRGVAFVSQAEEPKGFSTLRVAWKHHSHVQMLEDISNGAGEKNWRMLRNWPRMA